MDAIDAKLLTALQINSHQTTEALGRMAGLSPTACGRRLRRLRETGVIEAEVAVLSPKLVCRPMLAMVSVCLGRDRADIFDSFKNAVHAAPEVMQAFAVLGETDFVLMVSVRNLDDYEMFIRRFFGENPHIKGFKAMILGDRLKVGLAVPVDGGR